MKRTSLILLQTILLISICVKSLGQCNVIPLCQERFFSQSWPTLATGNDAKDYIGLSKQLEVMVWDGSSATTVTNSAGFGWDDYVGNRGMTPLLVNNAVDPDVTLVSDGSDIYALVVYYDLN